jgi:hypothetical protein
VTTNDIMVGVQGQFTNNVSNLHIYGHLGDSTKNFYALSLSVLEHPIRIKKTKLERLYYNKYLCNKVAVLDFHKD